MEEGQCRMHRGLLVIKFHGEVRDADLKKKKKIRKEKRDKGNPVTLSHADRNR